MKFSHRIQQVKPSMTLAIDAKAKELKAQGEDVIGFGAVSYTHLTLPTICSV